MIGIRCRGEDENHKHCRNLKCTCPRHEGEDRTTLKRELNRRGRTRGKRRTVYYMEHPEEGDTYEFIST